MLAYTIAAARDSGVFDAVIVSTDAEDVADIARHYGADVPFLRPVEFAGDTSPDIEWLDHVIRQLKGIGRSWDAFGLLRPTSPFRTAETIRRAWRLFTSQPGADSLRAVEPCAQHPGKMWVVRGPRMLPLMPFGPAERPWHSTPYQALPEIYVQNASLELAWTRVVLEGRTIAGTSVVPFLTEGHEGFDVNTARDWALAEALVADGVIHLPRVTNPVFPSR